MHEKLWIWKWLCRTYTMVSFMCIRLLISFIGRKCVIFHFHIHMWLPALQEYQNQDGQWRIWNFYFLCIWLRMVNAWFKLSKILMQKRLNTKPYNEKYCLTFSFFLIADIEMEHYWGQNSQWLKKFTNDSVEKSAWEKRTINWVGCFFEGMIESILAIISIIIWWMIDDEMN